jgi:hypothetical protein
MVVKCGILLWRMATVVIVSMGWDSLCVTGSLTAHSPSLRWYLQEWMNTEQRHDIDRGKPKISEENLSHYHFVHQKFHWTDLGANSGLRGEKPATNRLSYGTARGNTPRIQVFENKVLTDMFGTQRYDLSRLFRISRTQRGTSPFIQITWYGYCHDNERKKATMGWTCSMN